MSKSSKKSKDKTKSSLQKVTTDDSPLTLTALPNTERGREPNNQQGYSISDVSNPKKKKQSHNHAEKPRSKKGQKRARKEAKEDLEEERLTELLFGSGRIESTAVDGPFGTPMESKSNRKDKHRNNIVHESAIEGDGTYGFEIDRTGQGFEDNDVQNESVEAVSVEDRKKSHNFSSEGNEFSSDDDDEDSEPEETDSPAWDDPDDATTKLADANSRLKKLRTTRQETTALSSHELEERLRRRYEESTQATARTDWATTTTKSKDTGAATSDDDAEEEAYQHGSMDLFSTSTSFLSTSRHRLLPSRLDIIRCPDANLVDPNKAVVRVVNFHPGSDPDRPLLLTAGLDKTLRFFQVGEEKSEKIHGIHFPKMPIYSASFLGNSGKVVASGRRSFFYIYDAVAGKVDFVRRILGRDEKSWEKHVASPEGDLIAFVGNDGYVVLVDSHSKQCVGTLKLNGSVRAITFTPDGSQILASGSDGDVYRWDVKSRRCIERFANGDGTITSSLSASSSNLAVGAESGVVNLYSEHQQQNKLSLLGGDRSKTPIKSIMNLHTSADYIRFNSDGQILAMATQREKHGLKLLHVPSKTVFSNWPTSKTPLGYVWSMDFSPTSKFLAIGNDKGKCLLYKLNHYDDK